MTVDVSPAGLAAAAGIDPWALAEQVRSGDPAALQAGALRMRRAALLAGETAAAGDRADRQIAEGFRNDGVAVFDAVASTGRGAVLLADRGAKIEEAARAVLDVASALAAAAASTASTIAGLDAELNRLAGLATAEPRYAQLAVDVVRGAGARIQANLDDYTAVLVNRTTRLDGLGYGAAAADTGAAASASSSLAALLDDAGHLAGAVVGAVGDNPEAVLGLLVGLGAVAAGSSLVAGGVVVTGGTGGAGVVVGGPAASGGYALLAVGGALLAAATEKIAEEVAGQLGASPPAAASPAAGEQGGQPVNQATGAEPTLEARRAGVRESVLDPDGSLPGEPGRSSRVRVVDGQRAEQIRQSVRERLGPPDQVVETPGKGKVEIWDVAPDEVVVIRDFSTSGSRGTAGDETIDIRVQGLEGVKKIHVQPE